MKRNTLGFIVGAALALVMTISLITGASASSSVGDNIGRAWHPVASVNVGAGDNVLNSVYAVNANNVWAVGNYTDSYGHVRTMTQQGVRSDSNSTAFKWSIVDSPNPGVDNYLLSVSYARTAVSPANPNTVWAVGYYINDPSFNTHKQALIMKYNPISLTHQWVNVSPAKTNFDMVLNAVAGSAYNNYMAVGYYFDANLGLNRTLIMHYDGKTWRTIASPNQVKFDNYLTAISVQDKNTAWAVGYYLDENQVQHSLLLTWDGQAWKDRTDLLPTYAGANSLNGVSLHDGNSSAWLVGYDSAKARPIAFYQYKEKWLMNAPTEGRLTSVDFISNAGAWAVGYDVNATPNTVDRAYYWNGNGWVDTSPINTGLVNQGFQSVSGVSVNDVWAVGWTLVKDHYVTQIQHYN